MKYTVRLTDTNYYEIDVNAETEYEAREKAWDKLFALSQQEKDKLVCDSDGDSEIIQKEVDK